MSDEGTPEGISLIDTHFRDRSNYTGVYLLKGPQPALIDTGSSKTVDTVLGGIRSNGVNPEEIRKILVTHLHLDHAGGGGYLLDYCENARLYCHPIGEQFLTDSDAASKLVQGARDALGEVAQEYGDIKVVDEARVECLEDGQSIEAGGRKLEILEAPGHAPHQICPYDPREGVLFTGDEAGIRLNGTLLPVSPPPDFDFDRVLESVDRFQSLDLSYLAYAHFGFCRQPYEVLGEYRNVIQDWVELIRSLKDGNDSIDSLVDNVLDRGTHYLDVWDRTAARESVKSDVAGVLHFLES